jgi:hypothetical protein
MTQNSGSSIFISYSRKDVSAMRRIAFHLRDMGLKIWVDNEKLIPGTTAWEESIENAIKNAFIIIVILSPDSKSSEWVRREITYADQFNKRIFPVLVRGAEESSLPIRLITRQYIDLRTDDEAGLDALSAAIKFYIEEKQTLEMKRPLSIYQIDDPSHSTQQTDPKTQKTGTPNKWLIATGFFLVVCMLGIGTLWVGSRISGVSTTSNELVNNQIETSPSTESASPPSEIILPTNTDVPKSNAPLLLSSEVPLQYLENVQIIRVDTFDDQTDSNWGIQNGEINNGTLQIYGNENWDGAWYKKEFIEGEGFILDFSFAKNSTFVAFVNYGGYLTNAFRRFGIYFENDSPLVDVYQGEEYIWKDPSGDLTFEADKIYSLMIAILPNGELLEVIWDPGNPGETFEYRNKFDETWSGLSWTLLIQANKGTVSFDNFREIAFSVEK